jgi:peptidyl-prolyl cis-trans isomerase SurA
MMRRGRRIFLMLVGILLSGMTLLNSQVLVESIAAIVGNEVVYLSEIEEMVNEIRLRGEKTPIEQLRCMVLQELLVSKLFLDQARIDSITIGDDAVEGEVNAQINSAIRQAGSEQVLMDYFKKNMIEIRRDIRKRMIDQEIIRQVQGVIAEDVTLTPRELKKYYSEMQKDSLPVIPARVQVSIIQLDPPQNEENKAEARQKLLDIRAQILEGKSFSMLAVLYSEDPGSAINGGEIGYKLRGELEKPYADAAWSLTKNTVSRIVETRYGFHIIQVIDRKGDMLNTRHILIRPKVKPEQESKAMAKLDSIANLIRKDSLTFEKAAVLFSTHKDSWINGGKYVHADPSNRNTWFSLDEFDPEMYAKIRELNIGEISAPFRTNDENNNPVFRIVRLDNEIPAHRANLKDDYQTLYNAALLDKRSKIYQDWIKKKIAITYIKISDEFKSCDFLNQGWLK